jgi:hypothetical protein
MAPEMTGEARIAQRKEMERVLGRKLHRPAPIQKPWAKPLTEADARRKNGPVVVKRQAQVGPALCDGCDKRVEGWADVEEHFKETGHRTATVIR